MSDTANDRRRPQENPPTLGPPLTPDGTLAAWVWEAMERAERCGIDRRRVPLALGVPERLLDDDARGRSAP